MDLKIIKEELWKKVSRVLSQNKLPYSEEIRFGSGGIVASVEVTKNSVVDLVDIYVFIERLPATYGSESGSVDIMMQIPDHGSCSVDSISLMNWTMDTDDVGSLEENLAAEWNG